MSDWWLLLIVPAAASVGALRAGLFNNRLYDRGWDDGYARGWLEAWTVSREDMDRSREAMEEMAGVAMGQITIRGHYVHDLGEETQP